MMSSRCNQLVAVAALLAAPSWLLAACLGDIRATKVTTTSAGGQAGGGGIGGGSAGGGGSGCVTPPDGYCDEQADCACASCAPAAACTPGGCMANGFCDLTFEDTCICSDCDDDSDCMSEFGGGRCTDDGNCDSMVESCACADCLSQLTCVDNQQLCQGGAPDGQCTAPAESCGCNDCLGHLDCLCIDTGYCGSSEPCVCADCWTASRCSEPTNCIDDGGCALATEGCQCSDCATLSQCVGF